MISEIEKTILYLMAEAIAYEREDVIDSRIEWGVALLTKISKCKNKEDLFT